MTQFLAACNRHLCKVPSNLLLLGASHFHNMPSSTLVMCSYYYAGLHLQPLKLLRRNCQLWYFHIDQADVFLAVLEFSIKRKSPRCSTEDDGVSTCYRVVKNRYN